MPFKKLEFSPPIVAHRGASAYAPENTMEAFIAARDAGVKWVEGDIKLTSDGIPVLMHDETLDRTTTGSGPVSAETWERLQKLDAGRWFSPSFAGAHIASLAEVLAFCAASKLRLIMEIKPSPGRTQATVMVALIEAHKIWPENLPPPLISSFDKDALTVAAQLHPDWPREFLINEWSEDWIETVIQTQALAVSVNDALVTPQRLAALLSQSPVPVLVHTVNDPSRAKELLRNGIAAVYSDDIGTLLRNGII